MAPESASSHRTIPSRAHVILFWFSVSIPGDVKDQQIQSPGAPHRHRRLAGVCGSLDNMLNTFLCAHSWA